MQNKCLIINGTHRSGTSYAASVLQKAGLHIGETLLGADNGNIKDHFENEDFLNFHIKVLQDNKLHAGGLDLNTISYQEKYKDEAETLIKENSYKQWGWKDPRTIFFLDFWKQLLPDACFFFVYRAPWEVVDSLYRRGDETFKKTPEKAIEYWFFYNQQVINFCRKHPENSMVYNLDSIIYAPDLVINQLNQKFNFDLKYSNKRIFDKSIFGKTNLNPKLSKMFVEQCSPKVMQLYNELEQMAHVEEDKPHHNYTETDSKLVYEHWFKFYKNQIEINSLTKKINQMENSPFWKLHEFVVRVKSNLSSPSKSL